MNGLLGALGLADDGVADVRGDGLPVLLGGRGDQGGLVVAEVHGEHLSAGVRVLGSTGHWGHASQSSESTRGTSTPRLDTVTFPSTLTSMKSTRALIEYLRGVAWLATRILGVIALVGTVAYR